MECVRPCRSTCCHADVYPIVISTTADSPRLPHVRSLPPLIFQQQNAPGYMPRHFAPPVLTVGCTRLGGRAKSARNVQTYFPSVPDYPHICFLRDLPLQLAAVAAASAAAAVAECARPRRTTYNTPCRFTRRGCPQLYSHREASAAAANPSAAHDHAPVVGLWLLLYIPASAGISPSLRAATPSPSESSDNGGTASLSAAPAVGGD